MDAQEFLPLYHPTTVVYVDDDRELLSLLPARTGVLPYKCFHDPLELVRRLGSGELPTALDLKCWNRYTGDVGDPDTEDVLGLDKWMIGMRVFNRHRFELVSVLVVDYDMPGMSGLTLCRRLADLPCKRLLLTGRGGAALAVQALNDGLIDMYLPKDQPDLDQQVSRAVRRLQRRYFAETSRLVADFLVKTNPAVWADEVIRVLFRQHCADRGVVEWYAVSDPLGYLMLDGQGNGNLWLVFGDDEIEAQCLAARQLGAPPGVIAQMEGRQAIVYVGDAEGNTVMNPHQWWSACLALTPIPGPTERFLAITRDAAPYRIGTDTVLSCDGFLGSMG
jgi:CheY-like chemotaxis protein